MIGLHLSWVRRRQLGVASAVAHAAVLIGAVFPVAAFSADDARDFVKALREQGYGDLAVQYLERVSAEKQVPESLADVFDLERSASFRAAAKIAYNAEQAQSYRERAQQSLAQFLKEHPRHPAVAEAALAGGDFQLDSALQKLAEARASSEPADKPKLLDEARGALKECLPFYADAKRRFQAQLAELPPAASTGRRATRAEANARTRRLNVEAGLVECRFKEALVAFQIAETLEGAEQAEERKKLITEAGKTFNQIYREYKSTSEVGLQAHFWKARSLDELGDKQTALEIYDEVDVMEPEGPKATPASAPFYSQVTLARARLLASQDKSEDAARDLAIWLASHENWNRTPSYQGVAMELAKLKLASAEKSKGDAKKKLVQDALALLAAIGKVDSEYRTDALLLRRQFMQSGAAENANADESLAYGEESLRMEQWADAKKAFARALELSTIANDGKKSAAARERLNQANYRLALSAFSAGKPEEALALASEIVNTHPDDPSAPAAAGVALFAAHSLYSAAKDKQAALAELERIAQLLLSKWPTRPEADEARIMLAQSQQIKGQPGAALALFDQVRPESKRYAAAQLVSGQMFWRKYVEDKKQGVDDTQSTRVTALRDKAIARFQTAVETQPKTPEEGQPLSATWVDARLMLSLAQLDAENGKAAVAAIEPLIAHLKTHRPKQIDQGLLRICATGVRAYLSAGDSARTGDVIGLLVDQGADESEANAALVDFLKLIAAEAKKAEAARDEAEVRNDLAAAGSARERAQQVRQVQSDLLDKLLPREKYSVANMIYLADTCAALGRAVDAREQYKRILSRAETDAEFKKSAEKALTRIRAQVIGLLRDDGRFDEALKQVDALIAAHPNSLEPMMEKARILQAWSAREPKHFEDCIAQWTKIRLLLGRLPKKPPEYYDAIYNAATCLLQQAAATGEKKSALQAEQLLRSTLTLSPSLDGPETVAKFNALLKKAVAAQGRKVDGKV